MLSRAFVSCLKVGGTMLKVGGGAEIKFIASITDFGQNSAKKATYSIQYCSYYNRDGQIRKKLFSKHIHFRKFCNYNQHSTGSQLGISISGFQKFFLSICYIKRCFTYADSFFLQIPWVLFYTFQRSVGSVEPTEPTLTTLLLYFW